MCFKSSLDMFLGSHGALLPAHLCFIRMHFPSMVRHPFRAFVFLIATLTCTREICQNHVYLTGLSTKIQSDGVKQHWQCPGLSRCPECNIQMCLVIIPEVYNIPYFSIWGQCWPPQSRHLQLELEGKQRRENVLGENKDTRKLTKQSRKRRDRVWQDDEKKRMSGFWKTPGLMHAPLSCSVCANTRPNLLHASACTHTHFIETLDCFDPFTSSFSWLSQSHHYLLQESPSPR